MEVLILLLIVAMIIGALLGGNTFGGTIRKGCGFLLLLIIVAIGIWLFFLSPTNSKTATENPEVISTVDHWAYFIVKENCQTYIQPNIESDVSGNLEIGKEIFVEAINEYEYFYEINDTNQKKVFVRKECLKRK